MSIESEQYLRLKNKIYSDLNTTTFTINYWEKLKEIPQEIRLLQKLERLSVYRNKSIKKYPQELAELPNLRNISLRFNNLKQIPPVLGLLKNLETLTLSNNRFLTSAKWTLLSQISGLKKLDLSYSLQNLSSLPAVIGEISNLKELDISGNKLQKLPAELTKLKKLEKLYCEINDFEEFPIVFTQLPNLLELRVSAKSLKDLPDEVLDLQHIPDLTFTAKSSKNTPYIYAFERLLKNIKTYGFSRDFQLFLLSIIRGSVCIKDLNNKQLLTLLNCAVADYVNQTLTEIEKRLQTNQFGAFWWPKAGDKVVIKGKIKGKVSELKTRLKQNNISTGVKINKTTTHVLVGSMPNDFFVELQEHKAILLTEQMLVSYLNKLNQPYLLAASSEGSNLENIRQLLHSKQTENILLALEILKGGGFPIELLTELFLVYKFSRVQKIKRIIHQIVGQYAPLKFVTTLKSRKSIGHSVSEVTRRRNLEFYCKMGDLDKKKIAFYLLEKGKHGHLFALFNLSTADKKEYFSRALQDGHLSLAGLELTELPSDIGQIPGLTHLNISYNKFSAVPPQLYECKELKNLHLRGLYEIHKNPKNLWKIPALSTIYVGYNNKWIGYTNSNSEMIDGKKIIGR